MSKPNTMVLSCIPLVPIYLCGSVHQSKIHRLLLHLAMEGLFTGGYQSLTHLKINCIHRSYRNSCQLSRTAGNKIQSKTTRKLPKFSFFDFRTTAASIFINYFSKLSHSNTYLTSYDPKRYNTQLFIQVLQLIR